MITAKNDQSWVDTHQSLALCETDYVWLNELREAAILSFAQTGLPGNRDEDWRYTNLRTLKAKDFVLSSPSSLQVDLPDTERARVVFVDGFIDRQHSDLSVVGFTPLSEAWAKESVTAHFGKVMPHNDHGFLDLNLAYAQEGYVLEIAQNQSIDPIEFIFVWQQEKAVSHVHNLIVAAPNSQSTIIERHIGRSDQEYLGNCITEIVAGDNAHIDHYKIQQGSEKAFHMGGVFVHLHRSANVANHNIHLSGGLNRYDLRGELLGEGGHFEMNGLVIGQAAQHIDNHTEVVHAVPHCSSDEFYKTILDDQSRSVFRGRIVVAQDAQQTNADQQNNNLLLSALAEADCKPQLEIYADDVKCSHGATVGQLDSKSLFYLKSRGIDQQSAEALLTFAFANEVIERLRVDDIRQEITQILAGELLQGLEDLV